MRCLELYPLFLFELRLLLEHTILTIGYMKNPLLVTANPDRANIFYEVIQRPSCISKARECQ